MGFGFDLTDVKAQKDPTVVKSREYTCQQCALYKQCSTPKVQIEGEGQKGILIIGGGVSYAYENSKGDNHGAHYNFLKKRLKEVGINLKRDCWYLPAIRCFTKEDYGAVTSKACHALLVKDILKYNPRLIVTTSREAWDILLYDRMGGRAGSTPYAKWCGKAIPDQKLGRWVLPIYDTFNVMKDISSQENKKYPNYFYEPYYTEQLDMINEYVRKDVEIVNYDNKVKVAGTVEEAIRMLKIVKTWVAFAFDLETTGIRELHPDMRIHSISFSNGHEAFGMLWYDKNDRFLDEIEDVLTNESPKVAHNMQFEYSWITEHLGVSPKNIKHDPMIMQHCLHNQKPTNLKYLTYQYYGVLGYDESADAFLKPSNDKKKKMGANAINTIFNAPTKDILHYCALDSLFTYKLAHDLHNQLDPISQKPGYTLFMEASEALAVAHLNGFRIDDKAIDAVSPILEKRIDEYYLKVIDDPVVRYQWRGGKFNPGSDVNIRRLLFDILKIEPLEFTEHGLPSVDEEALLMYKADAPFIMDLLEYRRWRKVYRTFVLQLKRESVNGLLRSYYSLNGVATFRSSSRDVNIQNQPKRDKEALKTIRSLFFPHKGQKLVSYDYAQLEIRGTTAITQDPSLMTYVNRPDTDMHKDFATTLWLIDRDSVTKALRQVTKGVIFSLWYGSYYALIAKATWKTIQSPKSAEELGIDIKAHLKSKGIVSFEDWENHCQKSERWLWEEQFPVYQEWRKETYKQFKEDGYVDYPTGFRYYGPASRNAVLNAPGQGSSFHINVWAFTQINRELIEKKMKSKFIGQIHDSQIYSVEPEEEQELDYMVWYYSTQAVRDKYPWVNVPLAVDKSAGTVDGSWATEEDIGALHFEKENN
jgi:DNA polymerase I-like protein with 3'-5' exonuclease and polymerase domains/uracil-DNA glycosylase